MQKKMYLFVVLSVAVIIFLSGCTDSPFSFSYTGDYCADGLQDRDEDGVDCGGQYCDACTGTASETPAAETPAAAGTGEEGSSPEVVETPGVPYCTDTDNGDIYTGGTATAFDRTDTMTYDDICDTETKILTEYSCTPEENLNQISVECAFGCRDTTACLEEGAQDPDGDGLSNNDETGYGTDPFKADSDYDGLTDYQEVITYGTDPNNKDTDGDLIKDGNEVLVRGTDPLNADTDGDRFEDGYEVTDGTDPLDSSFHP